MRRSDLTPTLFSLFSVLLVVGACTTPRQPLAFSAGVVGTGAHAASREGVSGVDPAKLGTEWAIVRCEGCGPSQVEIEMRRSIAPKGGPGAHVFARVTNRNAYPVALVLVVTVQRYIDDESSIFETHPLSLGVAAGEDAARIVLLRTSDVWAISVQQVERY